MTHLTIGKVVSYSDNVGADKHRIIELDLRLEMQQAFKIASTSAEVNDELQIITLSRAVIFRRLTLTALSTLFITLFVALAHLYVRSRPHGMQCLWLDG